jgi:hypothetical protein
MSIGEDALAVDRKEANGQMWFVARCTWGNMPCSSFTPWESEHFAPDDIEERNAQHARAEEMLDLHVEAAHSRHKKGDD